jgi:hypothetical protein
MSGFRGEKNMKKIGFTFIELLGVMIALQLSVVFECKAMALNK